MKTIIDNSIIRCEICQQSILHQNSSHSKRNVQCQKNESTPKLSLKKTSNTKVSKIKELYLSKNSFTISGTQFLLYLNRIDFSYQNMYITCKSRARFEPSLSRVNFLKRYQNLHWIVISKWICCLNMRSTFWLIAWFEPGLNKIHFFNENPNFLFRIQIKCG